MQPSPDPSPAKPFNGKATPPETSEPAAAAAAPEVARAAALATFETNAPASFDYVDSPVTRRRRFTVHLTIVITVLFVIGISGQIWQRWSSVRLPTSFIGCVGDESTDGAELTVSPLSDRSAMTTATLSAENNYVGHVLVEPGVYRVKVTHKGHLLREAQLPVLHMRGVYLSIVGTPSAATRPTTAAATPGDP